MARALVRKWCLHGWKRLRRFMQIVVHFSGLFHYLVGVDRDTLEVPEGGTLDYLINILSARYNGTPFQDKKTFFMVNQKISDRDSVLQDGDHVMIFQMIGGG